MNLTDLKERYGDRRSVAVGAVVIIIVALGFGVWAVRRPHVRGPSGYVYVNELTGEFSVQPTDSIPPLLDASGQPTLVRAEVYTTGSSTEKKVAYYIKYTPEAKAVLGGTKNAVADPQSILAHGMLVRLPTAGSPWVIANSREGMAIEASEPTGPDVKPCSVVLPG
jgi:hypothetical protein